MPNVLVFSSRAIGGFKKLQPGTPQSALPASFAQFVISAYNPGDDEA